MVRKRESRALTGKAERDQRRSDFGRRRESVARNLEDEFGPRIKLREDGKVAVIASAGRGGEALGDFGLHDEVHFVDVRRKPEEMMQNRRSDVVGQISVDADPAASGERGEIGFENVARDDGEIRELLGETAQPGDELRIELDGINGIPLSKQMASHFAMAGADFDPAMLLVPREGHCGMRRDANRASDLFAPVEVRKKMLAESLASHGEGRGNNEVRTQGDKEVMKRKIGMREGTPLPPGVFGKECATR